MSEQFLKIWQPRKEISIDEGIIPFKGRIHFKVFNPNKPDKYGIKTFKLCNSTNGYCMVLDLYVGCDSKQKTKYGKTYDLVMNIM